MNEVMKALLERRSCKKYKADPVPQELIEQVIEAGLYAASGMGKQAPIVVAVTDKKLRDRLSEVNAEIRGNAGQDMFYGAPAVLVVLADKSVPTAVYDGSVAIENMLLAAHS
ncbi:MAG: nitroreductase family protein, partial [Pyramidobacter sp.]|nr:nitroreductase family protein [Pyramidobacter sp.]